MMLARELLQAPVIDHHAVDLESADRVTYLLEQSFRYDYATPVEQLRHRLVVLPPHRHGSQVLRAHRVEVAGTRARRVTRRDGRGNTVVRIQADRVESTVQFRIGALVERVNPGSVPTLPGSALADPRLRRPTRLTAPDERIRELAHQLQRPRDPARELAMRMCVAVHTAMTYEYGITTVGTTAAQALAGGRGVCQDSAHVMLALCHVLGVPARYVSGHLLGQGGTHAWVEVVVAEGDHAVAMAYDPCNGVAASARYLTVATGRDYTDVCPTSGSYVGAAGSSLTTDRRVAVLAAA